MDKDFVIEELEREIVRQDDYIDKLEKENEALTEENHILKSQLNRKSASMGRSAEEYIDNYSTKERVYEIVIRN